MGEYKVGEDENFNVPILLIMFNRPNHAKQVLEQIRLIKPIELFVAVDGPRKNLPADNIAVQQCLSLIDEIDWPCTVKKLVRERNLGCKLAVSSAIDWFFNNVEEGIILEDDCVPDVTFFDFCKVLLFKYRNEEKVMHIGGANVYDKNIWSQDTYFFSYIPHVWGWATWRRAWKYYDVTMQSYRQMQDSDVIKNIVDSPLSRKYWEKVFDATYYGKINTWDYQWLYAIWKKRGFCVIPNYNMIRNIGFDGTGTNTTFDAKMSALSTVAVKNSQIMHPTELTVNAGAVEYALSELYKEISWWESKISYLRSKLKWKK